MRYYITKIKGDERTVLKEYDNLHDALKDGANLQKEHGGTIDCIGTKNAGDFTKYKLYEVWS